MRKISGYAAVLLLFTAGCAEAYDPNNEVEARSQCEGFVDKRLKAPATADYDLDATQIGEEWHVSGTVDSENGFGALVRSRVRCVLHFTGDTAYLDDIWVG